MTDRPTCAICDFTINGTMACNLPIGPVCFPDCYTDYFKENQDYDHHTYAGAFND